MKILKKGIIPRDKIYTVACKNCHTRFQFKQHEGKICYDNRDGDYVTIECPLCKEIIYENI